jgi:hypothetical protein
VKRLVIVLDVDEKLHPDVERVEKISGAAADFPEGVSMVQVKLDGVQVWPR